MTATRGDEAPFGRIGISGTGLIGGSIALAVRRLWPSVEIVGTAPRRGVLPEGMLDRAVRDVTELCAADLIVLAVPVPVMADQMRAIAATGSRAVVTDVGSTKRRVMAMAEQAGLASFLGGHPMAGAERPGAQEARADLFEGRPWLLVEGSASPEQARRFETLVRALGAVPRWMPADAHDRAVAGISHLPQVIASALMNAAEATVPDDGPHAAGNAFAEMTRLASSPAPLWEAICAENADYLAELLATFIRQLPTPDELKDGSWVTRALTQSGVARDRWRAVRAATRAGE